VQFSHEGPRVAAHGFGVVLESVFYLWENNTSMT
jgi:hypothetical protein